MEIKKKYAGENKVIKAENLKCPNRSSGANESIRILMSTAYEHSRLMRLNRIKNQESIRTHSNIMRTNNIINVRYVEMMRNKIDQ